MKRLALSLMAMTLAAQTPQLPSPEEELLALLNTPVTVASRKAMTARETPGIVTVVTREDILASGARDMTDILAMIPGFTLQMDDYGVIGPAFRGLWGFEGKILMLWDGIEMNETLYGNLPLGNHYPVDQIKRVEVIRGPGSAMYGGFAEVAVIQVTTLQAEDVQGGAAGVALGRGDRGAQRVQANALFGHVGDGFSLSAAAFGGKADLGGQDYTDSTGLTYNMKGHNTQQPTMVNVTLKAGGFQARFLTDQYQGDQQDTYGVSLPRAIAQRFTSNALDLRFEWKATANLTLTPYAVYRDEKPWWTDAADLQSSFKIWTTRQKEGVLLDFQKDAWDLQGGAEAMADKATIAPGNAPYYPFLNGTSDVSYQDSALFGQAQYLGEVNLTLGGRFEHHSEAGNAFVPRFALTKVLGLWHCKFLAAQSFRTPNSEVINSPLVVGTTIDSEKTTSYEFEVGRQVGAGILALNVFDMKVAKPLVYTAVGAASGYANAETIESKGFELQYQARFSWGFLNAGYDWHTMKNPVSAWAVPGDDTQSLGMPSQSGSVQAGIKLGEGWTFNPNLHFLGSRQAYFYQAAAQGLVLQTRSADLTLGGTLVYVQGPWTASLGVYDATDRNVPYLQPYNGGHPPMQGMGREVVGKVKFGY